MLVLRSKAFLVGMVVPVFWWLALWVTAYVDHWLSLLVHNVGFAGYKYYVDKFALFAHGALFAVMLTVALRKWFANVQTSAFLFFVVGYMLGAILFGLIAPTFGVRVRFDTFFGFSWLVFVSLSLLMVLVQTGRRNANTT